MLYNSCPGKQNVRKNTNFKMSYVNQVDGKRMHKLLYCNHIFSHIHTVKPGGRRVRDRMVVGFTTTCAIIAYHH